MSKRILQSVFGKATLAAVVLGGALCFAGAPNAQANEVVVARYGYRAPIVRRVYVAPRPYVYVAPRPYVYAAPRVVVRGWYDRFGCWHRY